MKIPLTPRTTTAIEKLCKRHHIEMPKGDCLLAIYRLICEVAPDVEPDMDSLVQKHLPWTSVKSLVRPLGFTLRKSTDDYRLALSHAEVHNPELSAYYSFSKIDILETAINWYHTRTGK